MPAGRPAKPLGLHMLHGTYRKERHRQRAAVELRFPPMVDLAPAAWLPADIAAKWDEIIPPLARNGVIVELDRSMLEVWCGAAARFDAASRALNQTGLVLTDRRGRRMHNPYLRVMRDASKIMLQVGAQFGMSPSTRARLRLPRR